MSYPIAITTYNRPGYFASTLNSLEKSNADLSNLTIFDDCSTDKKQIDLLNNCGYKVIQSEENKGTTLNTTKAIEYMYNAYDSHYMILLQDDIQVSKSWLERGVESFDKIRKKRFNVAYMSLFNRDKVSDKDYYIMNCGHPGAVGWIIDWRFWNIYKTNYDNDYMVEFFGNNDKKNSHHVKNVVDYKLTLRIYKMGWVVAKVGKSLIQHIGDKSTMADGKDMTYCRTKNFVGENK